MVKWVEGAIMKSILIGALLAIAGGSPVWAEDQTSTFGRPERQTTSAKGESIWAQRCSVCHDHAHDRIPLRIVIERKSPEGVIAALTSGPMRPMAEGLSKSDIRDVAIYLTGKPLGTEPSPTANLCTAKPSPVVPGASDWASWGAGPNNALMQPNPGLSAADVPKLKLKWAFAYPGGTAVAEPVAMGGRLFLATAGGLFALDAETGCTFRGSVVALDAGTGKQLWKSYTVTTPPHPLGKKSSAGADLQGPSGGAVYAPLTIDAKRNVVYAATAESYQHEHTDGDDAIIAFDLDTGARKWAVQPRPLDNATACKNQDEEDGCDDPASALFEFAAPAILAAAPNGHDLLLAGQKSGAVYALDPDHDGKLVWETRVGQGGSMGGVEMGFSAVGGVAYVPVSDSEVKAPNVPGGLVALDIATGKLLWRTPSPRPVCSWGAYECNAAQAGSSAAIPGIVFSGAWDGHIRAYAMKDGAIVWDVDTSGTVQAVNKVKASGGAISGYPVIVSGGIVYVVSGASSLTHPGNALLAFSVEGK